MTGRCFTNGCKEAGIQNNHFGHLIGGASIDLIHFIGNMSCILNAVSNYSLMSINLMLKSALGGGIVLTLNILMR